MCWVASVNGIGANWGTQSSHPLPPQTVVKLLIDNGIQKVKLFDADYGTLRSLGKSGIEVMVGIPNDMLATMASNMKAADKWVAKNVSDHVNNHNVNIRVTIIAIAVYSDLGPHNVYESSTGVPSSGDFRADIHDIMIQITKFLNDNGSPFTVNIYPFISLYLSPDFPVEYAFFDGKATPVTDGGTTYTNMFDANYDTAVWALQKNGFNNMGIIVGEIGWPSDGDKNANNEMAQKFMQGFMTHISEGKGTPMRAGPIDAYLFSLIDEDDKSIQPGNFERHWGVFAYDGQPKYTLNLGTTNSGALVPAMGVKYLQKKWCVMKDSARLDDPSIAQSVSYACALGDCTSLGYGTSCGALDAKGNVSYAFNSYYQKNDQLDEACKFPNVSTITKDDPSTGTCRFEIMIEPYYGGADRLVGLNWMLILGVLLVLLW
nr:glucan endo-1,3-beta-glucosidase 6-like [Tanacetum cinerariifolium]